MEAITCESFEPPKTLDLPHVLACVDLPHVPACVVESESSEPITSESPNFTIEPVSSPVPARVSHNFSKVLSSVFKEKGRSRTDKSPRIQLRL